MGLMGLEMEVESEAGRKCLMYYFAYIKELKSPFAVIQFLEVAEPTLLMEGKCLTIFILYLLTFYSLQYYPVPNHIFFKRFAGA